MFHDGNSAAYDTDEDNSTCAWQRKQRQHNHRSLRRNSTPTKKNNTIEKDDK
jgi:hypothetical protein